MLISKTVDEVKGISVKYNSSNILSSLYDIKEQTLYIVFKTGGMYMYSPVSEELYNNFESAESQGKIFIKEIKNNSKIKYQKITKLKMGELDSMK